MAGDTLLKLRDLRLAQPASRRSPALLLVRGLDHRLKGSQAPGLQDEAASAVGDAGCRS